MITMEQINEFLSEKKSVIEYEKTNGCIITLVGSSPTITGNEDCFQLNAPSKPKVHTLKASYCDRVVIKADQDIAIFKQVVRLMERRAQFFLDNNDSSIVLDYKFGIPGSPNGYCRFIENDLSFELKYFIEIFE